MQKLKKKTLLVHEKYMRRKHRVNTTIKANSDLPRLIVNRTNSFNYAQLIGNDGRLIASANDMKTSKGTKVESAKNVGAELAKKALAEGVKKVVFDRNGFLYHGRVKAIAEGAREAGLQC